ncbi:MAG: cupredoxin domain-containing protein [Actinomycetota bacterium]
MNAFTKLGSVVLVIGLALGACAGGDGGDGNTVAMQSGQSFDPGTLTVSSGATVTFVNDSDEGHTVTAYEEELPEGAPYFSSGDFESEDEARDDVAGGLLSAGQEFEVTFDQPGTYGYFCIPHESSNMSGRIVVEE